MNKFKRYRIEEINEKEICDCLKICESIVDGFNKLLAEMPASFQLTSTQITSFVTGSENIRDFATKQQVEKTPAPAGMKQSKWEEFLYLPSEIEDYINQVYKFGREVKKELNSSSLPVFWIDDMVAFEGGKFVLNETANDLILKRLGLYVETVNENSAILIAKEIAKNMQQLEILMGQQSRDIMKKVVSISHDRQHSDNPRFILSLMRANKRS